MPNINAFEQMVHEKKIFKDLSHFINLHFWQLQNVIAVLYASIIMFKIQNTVER